MSPSDPRRKSLRKVSEEPHTLQGVWVDQNPELVVGWYALLIETERERDTDLRDLTEANEKIESLKRIILEGYDGLVTELAEALRDLQRVSWCCCGSTMEGGPCASCRARAALARLDGGKEPEL